MRSYDTRAGQEASLAIPAELDGVPVSSIGPSSFGADIYLMELTIPEGITNLGDYAFQRCSNLTTVSLPRSLKDVGLNPFEGCEALSEIRLVVGEGEEKHPSLSISNDGVLFSRADHRLIYYPMLKDKGSYTIPRERASSVLPRSMNVKT